MTTFYNISYNNEFSDFKISKCCLENTNVNISRSYLDNNFFIWSKKDIISVTFTPSSSITSFNYLIFYFLGEIFSCLFYKGNNFNMIK